MMDAILKPDVQEVIIQKSTQIQKAETSQNLVLDSFRVLADDLESMTISAFVGTNPQLRSSPSRLLAHALPWRNNVAGLFENQRQPHMGVANAGLSSNAFDELFANLYAFPQADFSVVCRGKWVQRGRRNFFKNAM
jgi:hypothetical protein